MIILDTSGLLAALDDTQVRHAAAATALRAMQPPRFLSPFVLAELDYLLGSRVSRNTARRLLGEVADGAYQLEPFETADMQRALEVIDQFADHDIGIADASVVVLAERHATSDVLTLDERHFRVLLDRHGRPFRLLPADPRA